MVLTANDYILGVDIWRIARERKEVLERTPVLCKQVVPTNYRSLVAERTLRRDL